VNTKHGVLGFDVVPLTEEDADELAAEVLERVRWHRT
jgi:hypothetical protein